MGPLLALLPAVLPEVNKLLDRWFPDKNAQAAKAAELEAALTAGIMANAQSQIEVNKEEAKSESLFVSGWRPFIGWTCGVAFAYNYVIAPFMAWAFITCAYAFDMPALAAHPLPVVNLDESIWVVLMGMLGLGALRTVEKRGK